MSDVFQAREIIDKFLETAKNHDYRSLVTAEAWMVPGYDLLPFIYLRHCFILCMKCIKFMSISFSYAIYYVQENQYILRLLSCLVPIFIFPSNVFFRGKPLCSY